MKKLAAAVALVLVGIVTAGRAEKPTSPIDGRLIWSDYKENEAGAELKYKGNLVRLTGGTPWRVIKYQDKFALIFTTYSPPRNAGIAFLFDKAEDLANVEVQSAGKGKAKKLTVEGVCVGYMPKADTVILKDARIVAE